MLEFCLNKDYIEWKTPQSCSWRNGESYIRPFSHRMVDVYYLREIGGKNRWMVVARENCASASGVRSSPTIKECREEDFDRQCNILLTSSLDWVAIQVTSSYNKQVSLASGKHGTLPCYILCKENRLRGSYIPASLFHFLDKSNPLDFNLTSLFLASGIMPYGADSILKEVKLLSAGSQMIWSCDTVNNSEVEVYYPSKSDALHPEKIKSDVDPVLAFERIVKEALDRRLGQKMYGVIAQLSGGLDSGIVTGVASSMTPSNLSTIGLSLPPNEQHQADRRDKLISTFSLWDTLLPIESYSLLNVNGPNFYKNRAAWEEPHSEAFNGLFKVAYETGHDILLTGIGGDELFTPNRYELDGEEPPPIGEESRKKLFKHLYYLTDKAQAAINEVILKIDGYPLATPIATLEALMASAPIIAKAGLWPIHPFADPETVQFCQQLPLELRRDRTLQRNLLRSWGLPESVWNPKPQHKEEFLSFMSMSIIANAPAIQPLFEESRLHEMGIIDKNKLIDKFRKYSNKNYVFNRAHLDYQFYLIAATEIMLDLIDSLPDKSKIMP